MFQNCDKKTFVNMLYNDCLKTFLIILNYLNSQYLIKYYVPNPTDPVSFKLVTQSVNI